jgi:hypothetical protein
MCIVSRASEDLLISLFGNYDTPQSELADNPTFQALGSGIYWMVTVNAVVWMVAPLVAVTVRG